MDANSINTVQFIFRKCRNIMEFRNKKQYIIKTVLA